MTASLEHHARTRPILLWWGAGRGLADAGFEVFGIDIEAQPHYPFTFWQCDVLQLDPAWIAQFDLVWASPPCQQFCAYRRRDPSTVGNEALNLIPQTRELLRRAGRPYIIENVPSAPLLDPTTLCGSMFRLQVRRHRLFETSFAVTQPECRHDLQQGDFPQATNRTNRRKTCEIGVYRIPLATQQAAIGIGWLPLDRLSQAIPPAYSRYLAEQFLASR